MELRELDSKESFTGRVDSFGEELLIPPHFFLYRLQLFAGFWIRADRSKHSETRRRRCFSIRTRSKVPCLEYRLVARCGGCGEPTGPRGVSETIAVKRQSPRISFCVVID